LIVFSFYFEKIFMSSLVDCFCNKKICYFFVFLVSVLCSVNFGAEHESESRNSLPKNLSINFSPDSCLRALGDQAVIYSVGRVYWIAHDTHESQYYAHMVNYFGNWAAAALAVARHQPAARYIGVTTNIAAKALSSATEQREWLALLGKENYAADCFNHMLAVGAWHSVITFTKTERGKDILNKLAHKTGYNGSCAQDIVKMGDNFIVRPLVRGLVQGLIGHVLPSPNNFDCVDETTSRFQ
jgi:hypothetical protein